MDKFFLIFSLIEWMGIVAVFLILRTSNLFKRPLMVFQYPRREGIISVVLCTILLVCGFISRDYSPNYFSGISHLPSSNLQSRLLLANISVLLVGAALFIRRQPIRSAGWNKILFSPSFRLGLALAFLTIFLRSKVNNIINGINQEEAWALLFLLVICLFEETFFRGYVQPRLRSWVGNNYGWVATALLFALWRTVGSAVFDGSLPLYFAFVFAQGLLLGWAMNKSGHVIAPGIYRSVSEWLGFLI